MPDEDENFGGSLVLDFRKWWRHMQAKNKFNSVFATQHLAVFEIPKWLLYVINHPPRGFLGRIGWDRTSVCKRASGCRYQSFSVIQQIVTLSKYGRATDIRRYT